MLKINEELRLFLFFMLLDDKLFRCLTQCFHHNLPSAVDKTWNDSVPCPARYSRVTSMKYISNVMCHYICFSLFCRFFHFFPAFSSLSSFLLKFFFFLPLSLSLLFCDSSQGVGLHPKTPAYASASLVLFLFPSPLFLLSFLPSSFLSLSLHIFGAVTAAMPHRLRRSCF